MTRCPLASCQNVPVAHPDKYACESKEGDFLFYFKTSNRIISHIELPRSLEIILQ